MQISEDTPLTSFLVTAYESGTIWVNHTPYSQAIILTPKHVLPWDLNLLTLLQEDPELVLIGSASPTSYFKSDQLLLFYEKKIGVEVMPVEAACRTYNLLANEGRIVTMGLQL